MINNLGAPHKSQVKLEEAGKMYSQALVGYDKALGPLQVPTYIPALNTMQTLALLLLSSDRADESRELYTRT
jgi:hypothetical protein